MKSYPSILNSHGQNFTQFDAFVFDKLDGQNFRAEWSRKQGFYKFGSRSQMIDVKDPDFAPAVRLFRSSLEDAVSKIAVDTLRASRLVIFAEWHGPSSFAGKHTEEDADDMRLTLFDATVDKKGWLAPKDFRATFEDKVDTPQFLGRVNWTRQFVKDVREGLQPCTFEGVVGKNLVGPRYTLAKAKTQVWLDKVYALYDPVLAAKIAAS